MPFGVTTASFLLIPSVTYGSFHFMERRTVESVIKFQS
jgi:hypothetical protein